MGNNRKNLLLLLVAFAVLLFSLNDRLQAADNFWESIEEATGSGEGQTAVPSSLEHAATAADQGQYPGLSRVTGGSEIKDAYKPSRNKYVDAMNKYTSLIMEGASSAAILAAYDTYQQSYDDYVATVCGYGTATGTGTGTGTGTASGTAGLKAEISATYGISATDGKDETYPSGEHWTAGIWSESELVTLKELLAKFPEVFSSKTKTIYRTGKFYEKDGSEATDTMGFFNPQDRTVHIMDHPWARGATYAQGTMAHEMTHAFQAECPDVMASWKTQFWPSGTTPKSPSPTEYGNSQPTEDMAESVMTYVQNGTSMKTSNAERYEFIKTNVMGGKEFQ